MSKLLVSALILLETAYIFPSYILFFLPENLTLAGKSFSMNDAKVSGIFISEYIIELSSRVIIIELSEPRMSSVIPLYPSTPSNGATIFLSLS